jgi:hypothetical protein
MIEDKGRPADGFHVSDSMRWTRPGELPLFAKAPKSAGSYLRGPR